jgi:hypothetical protein
MSFPYKRHIACRVDTLTTHSFRHFGARDTETLFAITHLEMISRNGFQTVDRKGGYCLKYGANVDIFV